MEQKKSDEGKEITAMLCVVRKNLEDLPFLAKGESEDMSDKAFYAADMTDSRKKIDSIDTIVNSASPDLMGSKKTDTIDNLLHNLIDQKLKENNVESTFNQMICSELASGNSPGGTKEEMCISRIRCPRGKAVLTSGYELCDYGQRCLIGPRITRSVRISNFVRKRKNRKKSAPAQGYRPWSRAIMKLSG